MFAGCCVWFGTCRLFLFVNVRCLMRADCVQCVMMFAVCLFAVAFYMYLLCGARCIELFDSCLVCVVCCLVFFLACVACCDCVCCALCVGCCLLFVIGCLLFVVCCLLFNGCCLLFVMRCWRVVVG